MIGSKRWVAQQVQNELQNDKANIDFKIDEREIFVRMDAEVNQMARQSFFDNWKFSGANIDEQFLTRWDDDNAITVVDQANGQPSYMELPASWVDLPRNRGIDEIWPLDRGEYSQSVVVTSHRDLRLYQNNKAGNMQGRLFGYPKGPRRFMFGEANVGKKYGEKFGVSLVIRDSSQIGYDDIYPIPADKLKALIMILVVWFRSRRDQPTDRVRDSNDNG